LVETTVLQVKESEKLDIDITVETADKEKHGIPEGK
jgi:hypothetical protein